MTRSTRYWQFDDRNPAFVYGPGWSTATDVNAHDSTLSYTSVQTNVTIQFYGKTMWLFGVLEGTEHSDQPVYRYTLDNRYVSTAVADAKNETSYNEMLAYFYDLDSSYHTLFVENINDGATLYLDYYLVEPIPSYELTKSTGGLPTSGEPLSTSISEHPMLALSSGPSGGAAVGTIIGAVIGGVLGAVLIVVAGVVIWKKKKASKPYYYKSATAYEVLSDEFDFDSKKKELNPDSAAPTATSPHPSYPSSVYSLSSDRASTFSFSQQKYYPLPSEYESQKLLAKSNSIRSQSSSHSGSGSSTRLSDPSLPQEERPLL